jgi:hypothetical protein
MVTQTSRVSAKVVNFMGRATMKILVKTRNLNENFCDLRFVYSWYISPSEVWLKTPSVIRTIFVLEEMILMNVLNQLQMFLTQFYFRI